MYIKPKEGKIVPDYQTGTDLVAEGRNVDDHDMYWHRRHADGDIDILSEAPADKTEKAPAAQK